MRAFLITLVAFLLTVFSPAWAQTYNSCFEPDPPSCIGRFGTFDDEWSFNRCKQDVEQYVDEVSDFQFCLANWHDAVGNEVNETIEQFNCKARGESFC